MRKILLTTIAATGLLAGTVLASAQSQPTSPSPGAQPNPQAKDQSGTPGTGASTPRPGGSAGPAGTSGMGGSGMNPPSGTSGAATGGTSIPQAQPESTSRDQSGTPGQGRSVPAPAGSPRQ